jgi:hypothetical protein
MSLEEIFSKSRSAGKEVEISSVETILKAQDLHTQLPTLSSCLFGQGSEVGYLWKTQQAQFRNFLSPSQK